MIRLLIFMFILLSSCSDKAYENKNLIIFYDKSSVCKTKIYDFAEKNKLKIVYDMKNINSIVIGGIKKSNYNRIKDDISRFMCVYAVNDDELIYYNSNLY